jgi:hypothetical protein
MPENQRRKAAGRMRDLIEAGETPPELPIHFMVGLASLTY